MGRLGERGLVLHRERHQRAGAVDDLDVLDRADLDAGDPDVVALDHAGRVDELGLVAPCCSPKVTLPIVTTRTPVASVVTTMKMRSLVRSHGGPLVEEAFIAAPITSAPPREPSGRRSRTPRSGTSSAVTPRAGPSRDFSRADSWRLPARAAPVRCGRSAGRDPREVPLPVGSSTPSFDVGLVAHRVGLRPRRVRQVQAVGARGRRATRGWSLGGVAAGLVRQRLQHDVQGEAAERLGLAACRR